MQEFQNQLVQRLNDQENSSYYALVAPSWTGKTSFSHSIRSHKVIYVASGHYDAPKTQKIYKFYQSLSRSVDKCCQSDVGRIPTIPGTNLFTQLTLNSLITNHQLVKYESLGFLYGLLQIHNFGVGIEPRSDWLHAYAPIEEFRNIPQYRLVVNAFIPVIDEIKEREAKSVQLFI